MLFFFAPFCGQVFSDELFLFAQHRAAAAPAAAITGVRALGRSGVLLADLQIVIVGQLFARADVAPRFDENPPVFFLDLAVGRAGVVDPAGRVAAPRG